MKKPKPKQYEEEPEPEVNYTVGSYQRTGGGKSRMRQIGFIRREAKKVTKKNGKV